MFLEGIAMKHWPEVVEECTFSEKRPPEMFNKKAVLKKFKLLL